MATEEAISGDILPARSDEVIVSVPDPEEERRRIIAIIRDTPALKRVDLGTQCLRGKTATGRRTYISRLNQVADIFGVRVSIPDDASHKKTQSLQSQRYRAVAWHKFRAEQVTLVLEDLLKAGKSFRTINLTLAALRLVAREVFQTGLMSGDDLKRIELVKGVQGSRLPVGRRVSAKEIGSITKACEKDTSPAGVRDQAIMALLYACGLRRVEVAQLRIDNLKDISEAADSGKRFIQLVGKKNKERKNFPGADTWSAIDDWLAIRKEALAKEGKSKVEDEPKDEGHLFCPINKGGSVMINRGLSDQSIYKIVQKRTQQAELNSPATPHDFRRSFVTELLDQGVDLKTVADLAGHSSVETTAVYDRRDEEKRKKAQSKIEFRQSSDGDSPANT